MGCQTLTLNVWDAPKAQFGQIVPLALACPFGTLLTPHFGVCAGRTCGGRYENRRNKARMLMKTKDEDKKSWSAQTLLLGVGHRS